MSFRPENEIKSSFAQAAQTLDLMLEKARPQLELNQILILDESNRSGFDKSGVPYYLWEYRFEKRMPYGSEIMLASVRLNYLEPPIQQEAGKIRAGWTAEIFQTGKQSRVKKSGEQNMSLEELTAADIGTLINNLIVHAQTVLLAPDRK
jgi:hypothetical protein